jgi:MYXO-CTERM domain-containing protein
MPTGRQQTTWTTFPTAKPSVANGHAWFPSSSWPPLDPIIAIWPNNAEIFLDRELSGPFAVTGTNAPTRSEEFVGLRCARELPEPGGFAPLGVGAAALAGLVRIRRRSS